MLKKNSKYFIEVTLVLSALIAVLFVALPENREYCNGELIHYEGESFVSQDEAVSLLSEHFYQSDVRSFELQEDGSVYVEYEFYGKPGMDYLTSLPHSVFDSPVMNAARETWWIALIFASMMIFLYFVVEGNKRVNDIFWYLFHPTALFDRRNLQGGHKLQIFPSIKAVQIDTERPGILAVRTWQYNSRNGMIYSASARKKWSNKFECADKAPREDNTSGIYAYRLGAIKSEYPQIRTFFGIVRMCGDYTEHADGVIRAEACNILCFVVNKRYRRMAESLSVTYGVPVVAVDNPLQEYQQWLWSTDGIACLKYNNEILKEEVSEDGNAREGDQKGENTLLQADAGTGTGIRA